MTTFADAQTIEWDPGTNTGRCEAPEAWLQGRTVFGGLQAAWCIEAAERAGVEHPDWKLVSFSAEYLAPITPGPVDLAVEQLRVGGSTAQYNVKLTPRGTPSAAFVAHVVVSRPRDVPVTVPQHETVLPPVSALPTFPPDGPMFPQYMQQMEHKPGLGELPYSGSKDPRSGGYARHTTEAKGLAAVVGAADAWPPPVLALHAGPMMASTVQWHVFLTDAAHDADPGGWFGYETEAVASSYGYAATRATITQGDAVVATWTQSVAMFPA